MIQPRRVTSTVPCLTGRWRQRKPAAFLSPQLALVLVCPGKTAVPIYRKHVIAQIKPTTRTRIDAGLALKDEPITGRLVDTGGFDKKDRITRRIEIGSLDEVDGEVEQWLRKAYELDA